MEKSRAHGAKSKEEAGQVNHPVNSDRGTDFVLIKLSPESFSILAD
ncbi:hypothetical protein [Sunxiuqinia rutila]